MLTRSNRSLARGANARKWPDRDEVAPFVSFIGLRLFAPFCGERLPSTLEIPFTLVCSEVAVNVVTVAGAIARAGIHLEGLSRPPGNHVYGAAHGVGTVENRRESLRDDDFG